MSSSFSIIPSLFLFLLLLSVQIGVCGQLVFVSVKDCFLNGYNIICQPVDYSVTPLAMKIAYYCYVYYAVKVIDLLDTVRLLVPPDLSSFPYMYYQPK